MAARITRTELDYLDGPEQRDWKSHVDLVSCLPYQSRVRNCIGMALTLDASERWVKHGSSLFVPDRDLSWSVMQDLRAGDWECAGNRNATMATMRHTTVKYGMPRLDALNVLARFDMARTPADPFTVDSQEFTPHHAALSPTRRPQRLRVFNAVNWAMTSVAFNHDPPWKNRGRALYKHFHRREPRRGGSRLYVFGDPWTPEGEPTWTHLEEPEHWMPIPWLAFPSDLVPRLWSRIMLQPLTPDGTGLGRYYDAALRAAFLEDVQRGMPVAAPLDGVIVDWRLEKRHLLPVTVLIIEGIDHLGWLTQSEVIVRDTPHTVFTPGTHVGGSIKVGDVLAYDDFSLRNCRPPPGVGWERAAKSLLQAPIEGVMRIWFERQAVKLASGYLHLPAHLAATAAFGAAVDAELFWDVTPSLRYLNETVDAMIFPPVLLRTPEDLYDDPYRVMLTDTVPADLGWDPADPVGDLAV